MKLALLLLPASLLASAAAAQEPVTVDQALLKARAANARLPIPAYDIAIAQDKVEEARAERWLKVAVEGGFIYAPPSGYDPVVTNSGEFRLQAVGRQPLTDGGARRAAVARARADLAAAGGRYRIAEKDLYLEVVTRFNEMLAAREELAARQTGIARLESYRTSLKSRRASGQAVAADLLKTDVRVASEEASILEAQRRLDDSRIALNDLMGRAPAAPLELAPPAFPDLAAPSESRAWGETPEVAEALAEVRSADAALTIARAERKPHLDLSADVGFWGSDTSRLVPSELRALHSDANFADRIRRDAGYSFTLSLTWPIFDFGAIRARVAQADHTLAQAKQKAELARRDSYRQWEQARSALRALSQEIALLAKTEPVARDAYLEAESRYRGGAASSLEVIDAYAASIEATVRLSEAVSRYRISRALAERWGTP
jgi:multidrug efflux system outer membrane protein